MNKLKYHFLGGLVFLGTIVFGYVGYTAYTNLATQTDGATITKDIWNEVINTMNSIGAKTDELDIKTSNIYQSGGNIGIGKINPQTKLEINGDLNVTGKIINNPNFMAQTICGVMNTVFDYGSAYKMAGGNTCNNFCLDKEDKGVCVGGLLANGTKTARFDCTYSLPVDFTDGYCCCR